MIKIIRYTFFDLMRSSWSYFYLGFYLLLSSILLFLSNDVAKSIITFMNIVTILIPLIATIFGVMYYYNSREFIELLLAQPLKRTTLFVGQGPHQSGLAVIIHRHPLSLDTLYRRRHCTTMLRNTSKTTPLTNVNITIMIVIVHERNFPKQPI